MTIPCIQDKISFYAVTGELEGIAILSLSVDIPIVVALGRKWDRMGFVERIIMYNHQDIGHVCLGITQCFVPAIRVEDVMSLQEKQISGFQFEPMWGALTPHSSA